MEEMKCENCRKGVEPIYEQKLAEGFVHDWIVETYKCPDCGKTLKLRERRADKVTA